MVAKSLTFNNDTCTHDDSTSIGLVDRGSKASISSATSLNDQAHKVCGNEQDGERLGCDRTIDVSCEAEQPEINRLMLNWSI